MPDALGGYWRAEVDEPARCVRRSRIRRGARELTFADAVEGWHDDPGFRSFFLAQLGAAPFASWFWETPPVTRASFDRPFEFVLADAPELARMPVDAAAFAAHFRDAPASGVVVFPNLGHDAVLVAPTRRDPAASYPHFAAFVRHAPEDQQHALLVALAEALTDRLDDRPVWTSTSGLGIAWLHVRLDDRPKYVTWRPYREDDGSA